MKLPHLMTPEELKALDANLEKLRQRDMCFDLMVEFFDRAIEEDNIPAMQGAYDAMVAIHRGNSRP